MDGGLKAALRAGPACGAVAGASFAVFHQLLVAWAPFLLVLTPVVGAVMGVAMGLAWHAAHRARPSLDGWPFGAAIGAGMLPGAFHALMAGPLPDDDTGPARLVFLALTVAWPIVAGVVLTRRVVAALAMGIAGFVTTASIIQFSIGLDLLGRFGVFVLTQVATFTACGSLLERWYARWRTGKAAPAVPGTSEPA